MPSIATQKNLRLGESNKKNSMRCQIAENRSMTKLHGGLSIQRPEKGKMLSKILATMLG